MNRSYLTALAIAGAVFVWLASGLFGGEPASETMQASGPASKTALIEVRTRDLVAQEKASELILFGRTEANRTVVLRAETAGRIATISAIKGQPGSKGDVIVRLTPEDRPARLKEADAAVDHAMLAYEAANKLFQKGFRSKVQLAENKSTLEAARARRTAIQTEIGKAAIRAPFAGDVNDIGIDVGDFLKVGDNVATIVDLDPMLVVAEISDSRISHLTLGGPAAITIAALGELTGAVTYISKTATPETRTFRIEVSVPNPGGAIAEGLTTELRLGLETVRAHLLSPAVLTLSDEGIVGVKTVNAKDVVEFHPVRIITDTPKGMCVGGLTDQVKIISVGHGFVKAGQHVRPVSEKSGDK